MGKIMGLMKAAAVITTLARIMILMKVAAVTMALTKVQGLTVTRIMIAN